MNITIGQQIVKAIYACDLIATQRHLDEAAALTSAQQQDVFTVVTGAAAGAWHTIQPRPANGYYAFEPRPELRIDPADLEPGTQTDIGAQHKAWQITTAAANGDWVIADALIEAVVNGGHGDQAAKVLTHITAALHRFAHAEKAQESTR